MDDDSGKAPAASLAQAAGASQPKPKQRVDRKHNLRGDAIRKGFERGGRGKAQSSESYSEFFERVDSSGEIVEHRDPWLANRDDVSNDPGRFRQQHTAIERGRKRNSLRTHTKADSRSLPLPLRSRPRTTAAAEDILAVLPPHGRRLSGGRRPDGAGRGGVLRARQQSKFLWVVLDRSMDRSGVRVSLSAKCFSLSLSFDADASAPHVLSLSLSL